MYNLVNSFQMPKLDIQRFERDDSSSVYMEIDEDHMKCRRSKNTYMRMVVIHRGIEEIYRDRNKLIDKHTIMFPAYVSLKEVSEYVFNYKEISKNLYKWLKGDDFKELENFYENFKEKENVSQRRKDQTKMLFNQYEKIREEEYTWRRIHRLKDGSPCIP